MSGLEVIRREFNGAECEVIQKEDGSLWMTSEQIGRAVGYEGDAAAKIRKAYQRHREELTPLRGTYRPQVSRPGVAPQLTAIWRKEALILFACFARTEQAKQFRTWLLSLCMELESGSKVLVEREHLERLQREAAGEGRVDPIDLAERRLALLKGATKALSSFPSPADPQFLSAAARLVICEGLGVGRELADAANKVDAECAESTQLIAKGEQVRLSMQASQAQPGEVYSFALARRFGWYASSGNPHGRAVLAAARAEGFGPEELRQGLVEVTEGVFKPVNIFTPAGVERFAFLDSHEERQVFEVKTDSQVFTVYRTPGGAPAADAEGGVA